jgi:hemolysin III
MSSRHHPEYSLTEELIHAITHGAGVILSIAGLSWMLYISIEAADPWRIAASMVYGLTLIALFLSSTVYHAMYASRHIFLMIRRPPRSTPSKTLFPYTPFLLVAMRTTTGWWMFGAIWTLATAGILTKLWFRHRFPKLGLAGYLMMGWLIVIAAPQVAAAVGPDGMVWLIAGGLSYTVGAAFYASKRIVYSHAIWHVFVLVGGLCHFLAIVWYVLPVRESLAISG